MLTVPDGRNTPWASNPESRRELELLEALSDSAQVTQRKLSARLGIALGLTNIYLKRLVHKGYVKCVNARSNRLLYLITPAGLAEKTRLTYEFMEYSLYLYRGARLRLRGVIEPLARRRSVRVAIFGTGEAAEIAYLCLKEFGVEPVAVFGEDSEPAFFSYPVRSLRDHSKVAFDSLVVATLDRPGPAIAVLEGHGVPREKLLLLREP